MRSSSTGRTTNEEEEGKLKGQWCCKECFRSVEIVGNGKKKVKVKDTIGRYRRNRCVKKRIEDGLGLCEFLLRYDAYGLR